MIDQASQERDPVEVLAEEFLERRRRGEVPSFKEYADRYPELAAEIREVFPALVLMDEIDPQSAELAQWPAQGDGQRYGLERIGDFRILRVIGQGGMGIVYEAQQESLGRHVALKVLPPAVSARSNYRERFQREARAAAQLHHTNIVPIFGVGEDEGVLYYAMQFIQGQALDAVLEDVRRIRGVASTTRGAGFPTVTLRASELARSLVEGGLQPAEMFLSEPQSSSRVPHSRMTLSDTRSDLCNQPEYRYFRSIAWQGVQAAEGLAHAHVQGILHRDIKPSNLLLDAKGTLWITDFGLAKSEGSVDITQSGEFVGTLRYMAPERLQGKGDARSDIYALGVTLYEMLTLSPPFASSDRVGLIGQITTETPPPPSRMAPLLPRDLETIVLKAMHRDAPARYATAQEMANDLRCFLENRPIKARRSSAQERLRRWCRRNPAIAGLLSAVFLLLLCLSIGSMVVAFRLNEQRNAVIAAEADGAESLYQTLVTQANASRFSHRVGQRFQALKAIARAADLVRDRHMPGERLDELRDLAIASLALADFREIRSWPGFHPADLDWQTDDQFHRYVRWHAPKGTISLRFLETNEETALLPGAWHRAEFSPGGQFLCADDEAHFQTWDVSGDLPRDVHKGEACGFSFHPDKRHLLVAQKNGSLWLYDLTSAASKPAYLTTIAAGQGFLKYDPAGKRLAAVRAGKVQILDAGTGQLLATVPESHRIEQVAWHPGGNYLALVSDQHDPTIWVWDLKRMSLAANLLGSHNVGVEVAFTPDGERLLGTGWEGMIRMWDWRTGQELFRRPGKTNLVFGPEDHLLVLDADGKQLSRIEVATAREYRSIVQQSGKSKQVINWKPVCFPGGRLCAVSMMDRVRLFDLATGEELADLPPTQFTVALQADQTLLTNGAHGLLRWPIRQQAPGRWLLGPPECLHTGRLFNLACDKNGAVIAQANLGGALLVRPGKNTVVVGPHKGTVNVHLSLDGMYLSTGVNDGEEKLKVWNTRTLRLVASFPAGRHCLGNFSSDGRWLAIRGANMHQIVRVGTWETVFEGNWDKSECFSPDGAVLATVSSQGDISLLETDTGKVLARLEDPGQSFGDSAFTPDGTKLLISSDSAKAIHIWDLRLIRAHLAQMGLDWDAPPLPASSEYHSTPLELHVDLGSSFLDDRLAFGMSCLRLALYPFDFEAYAVRARVHYSRKEFPKCVADCTLALDLMPAKGADRGEMLILRSRALFALGNRSGCYADIEQFALLDLSVPELLRPTTALQCNELAWIYLGEWEQKEQGEKALKVARKTLALNSENAIYEYTLGLVLYRLGQHSQAVDTLNKSLRRGPGMVAPFHEFVLAMCYARQGEAVKARDAYHQALKDLALHGKDIDTALKNRPELRPLQAAAEALLKAQGIR